MISSTCIFVLVRKALSSSSHKFFHYLPSINNSLKNYALKSNCQFNYKIGYLETEESILELSVWMEINNLELIYYGAQLGVKTQ